MDSKVNAATWALDRGVSVVICNGTQDKAIKTIIAGRKVGTFFTETAAGGPTPVDMLAENGISIWVLQHFFCLRSYIYIVVLLENDDDKTSSKLRIIFVKLNKISPFGVPKEFYQHHFLRVLSSKTIVETINWIIVSNERELIALQIHCYWRIVLLFLVQRHSRKRNTNIIRITNYCIDLQSRKNRSSIGITFLKIAPNIFNATDKVELFKSLPLT